MIKGWQPAIWLRGCFPRYTGFAVIILGVIPLVSGITFMIVSNNTGRRVRIYAKNLGVRAVCWMLKPFATRLKHFIKKEGFNRDEVLLVGDQLLTDILSGNGAKVRTLLVSPISRKIEPPWTKTNRFFEKRIRVKILLNRLTPYWRALL